MAAVIDADQRAQVALVSRQDAARAQLRSALGDFGADVVAEQDAGSLDVDALRGSGATVVIVIKSENAVFSEDGQPPTPIMEDDRVNVTAADVTAQFVRFGNPGYFYRNVTMHINENSSGVPQ